ncbi:3-deoxy-D-manno-octulosonate cytidylyltransferase [Magnetococcus marinus MC-1]|uniref:3-deoxy-D-manno-octulosonate cytidylyltransferase n=1 Tax=Magnetococcus marinus (strain ATCC BAA-1437 / JCM 17883 / MC-1) TaxID=156889 RepID=A0L9H5_MAGMM|nr:3-deoxy-manno-octulosonate cytidylyltransferase [Magnetococcus marinus]ABK44618.1 3-deoxy-D-manno-octulosonate cytidylyltransferase [Magnetococcus marinus MC-1]
MFSPQRAPRVLAVIPARWASSRFPGKPLVEIAGKIMIQRVWEQASRAACVDAVVIATDDARIEQACHARGMPVVMTRDDHPTGTDRLAEVAQQQEADIYLNVQGDEPLINPDTIDAVAQCLLDALPRGIGLATAYMDGASQAQKASPSTVHLVPSMDGCVITFSRLPVPLDFQASFDHKVHVGLYAFTRDALMEFVALERGPVERAESIEPLRFIERGKRIACVKVPGGSVGVDHPEDVTRVEALLKRHGLA